MRVLDDYILVNTASVHADYLEEKYWVYSISFEYILAGLQCRLFQLILIALET